MKTKYFIRIETNILKELSDNIKYNTNIIYYNTITITRNITLNRNKLDSTWTQNSTQKDKKPSFYQTTKISRIINVTYPNSK